MNWQYLAGFFDGEGHVGVHKGRGKYTQHDIAIANTHEPTIDAISRFLSSQTIKHSKFKRTYTVKHWKTAYKIKVTSIRAGIVFLELILPFLLTKREQALSTLEYLRRQTPRKYLSKETMDHALSLYQEGKTLRQVAGLLGIDNKTIRVYGQKVGFKFRSREEAGKLFQKSLHSPTRTPP